ncbi:MAG: hypothetical protein JW915_07850 [Chitinispirillaceae bacterium]|nr:hypothetical protein [Chitinispirillaceae bacterium]
MNFDDSRGNQNYQHRRPSPHKNSYSPNSVYYGNSAHNNQQQQQQQKKKHHSVHNKGNMSNDRLTKQNDTIIKLLKEIRDRLPAPAGTPVSDNGEDCNQKSSFHSEKVPSQTENDSVEVDAEDNDGEFDSADEDSFEVENEQN